ncbi:MAG: glycosyl transferase family [Geobacteraceae bacterium]|nr:MAG: glycosyl transferase family [Geobacteraceae bacterium]
MRNLLDISVCIASCNGEKYIARQLESILSQELPVAEIIISDDSSTDRTVDIIRLYNDARIKLLENNKFHSPIFNFENALIHASGEVIFLSDQDDIWMPNKVRVMKECLKHYDLVVSDASLIDADDSVIESSFFKLRNSGPGFVKNIYKNTYLGCCMAFNRNILEKSLPFPPDVPMHDMWLGMIAEIYGRTYFCKEKLVHYRRHSSNASPTGGNSCYKALDKIKFRFKLLSALAKRHLIVK